VQRDWNWEGARMLAAFGLITRMRIANQEAMPDGFALKVRVILFLSHARLQPGDKHYEGKVNRFNGLLLFSTAKVEPHSSYVITVRRNR
jgi:hypothetical protein